MNNKKGISAIVATVLIILITVAAVTIIWAAIIPMISNQLGKGTVCLDAVSQLSLVDNGYTCKNGNNISIQVKQGAKNINLADIQVLVLAGGSTTSYSLINSTTTLSPTNMDATKLPKPNEEKVYTIDTSGISGSIDKVEIAPVVTVGKTKDTCDISVTRILKAC